MKVDPAGGHINYFFEYISDQAYRANPPTEPFAGAKTTAVGGIQFGGPVDVSPNLAATLAPATVYHYRPVAIGGGGTTVGGEGLEHLFVTNESGKAFALPEGRDWEMVSPVDKNGGDVARPEGLFGGGDFQAGPNGAITYGSSTAFGAAVGAPPSSQYISRRTGAGWATENVSPPLDSEAYGDEPDGVPYRIFSADLARSVLFGGLACRGDLPGCPVPNQPITGSGAPPGYMAYYMRDSASGQFTSLLSAAEVAHSAPKVSPAAFEIDFVAASPDLSHLVLSSCAALTADAAEVAGAPGACDAASPNLYDWSEAGLAAVNLRPGDSTTTPGASVAAPLGAICADGSRIYWSDGTHIYLREGGQTTWVDEALGGGGQFQSATPNGGVAFFTKAGRLYRFTATTKALADLTPGGGVVGVLGAAADGSSVYFQDGAGLELWRAGTTTTIAAGADATVPSDYPPATATARVSADGKRLAFLSKASLTGFDNVDFFTKLADTQLYVYGPPSAAAGAELICASCEPSGERPTGPASIAGTLANGSLRAYRPRALSADGLRVFFEVRVAAKPGQGKSHVFEWQAPGAGGCTRAFGCRAEISGGGTNAATFVDASDDGTDAYFLTGASLVGADPGSIDLYDARVGGGFSEANPAIECLGDNCQSLPGEPNDPTPGTLVQTPGNPPLRIFSPKAVKKHHRKHHRRHRRRRQGASGSALAPGRGRR